MRNEVRGGGTFLRTEELVEMVDDAEDAATGLRSSNGVRSVVKSAIELVRMTRGDDGRDGGWLRRRRKYEYSARCVWIAKG